MVEILFFFAFLIGRESIFFSLWKILKFWVSSISSKSYFLTHFCLKKIFVKKINKTINVFNRYSIQIVGVQI